MSSFLELFSSPKVLIAMAHVPPLPGTPLYDERAGVNGLIDAVARDLAAAGGLGMITPDLNAGLESAAVMSRVVTECKPSDRPFGVDFLWDPRCALAVAVATGAAFMREVCTGVWESDMGLWQTTAAEVLRERRRLDASDLKILMNITPEFASPIGNRSPGQMARSTVVSSLADGILVSGAMAGAEADISTLQEVRAAVPPETPVLLNTGARESSIATYLSHADGCIVGSSLKVDGYTWNPVDRERALRFVEAARAVQA